MAFVCKLTDGTDEVDLYYSAAAGFSLLDEGIKPGRPESRMLYGGIAQDVLVQHYEGKRQIPLELYLEGLTDDDLMNRINELEGLLKQGRDFHLLDVGNEVFLEFQLSAATYVSRFPVLSGEMEIDRLMSMFCKDIQVIDRLPLVLTCRPYWEAAGSYAFENYLGTPHFEEDGNSDGLADQWTELAAPTTSLDTDIYLIGTQSQKVITDNTTAEGILSDNVSDAETSGVGYAWIYRSAGDDISVVLFDVTASGTRDTAKLDDGGWETKEGAGGNTWHRVVVSSDALVSGNNHQLRVYRKSADAAQATTFYVDQCYLELGTTIVPTGWGSCRDIYSHIDADVGHVNYFDIVDIPGDVGALLKMEVGDFTISGECDRLLIYRLDEITQPYYWDISGSADADRSGGQIATETPTGSSYSTIASAVLTPGQLLALNQYSKVFGVFKDDRGGGGVNFRVRYELDPFDLGVSSIYVIGPDSKWGLDTASNLWKFIDMGFMSIPDVDLLNPTDNSSLKIRVKRSAGTEAAHLDFVVVVPAHGIMAIVDPKSQGGGISGKKYTLDGLTLAPKIHSWLSKSTVTQILDWMPIQLYGDFTLRPKEQQRIVFIGGNSVDKAFQSYVHGASAASGRVKIEYRPRGKHLRGT